MAWLGSTRSPPAKTVVMVLLVVVAVAALLFGIGMMRPATTDAAGINDPIGLSSNAAVHNTAIVDDTGVTRSLGNDAAVTTKDEGTDGFYSVPVIGGIDDATLTIVASLMTIGVLGVGGVLIYSTYIRSRRRLDELIAGISTTIDNLSVWSTSRIKRALTLGRVAKKPI